MEREEVFVSKIVFEDFCVEFYMEEEYCVIMYKEVLKEVGEKFVELKINVLEREWVLGLEIVEKGILKEKIYLFECFVKEKENDLVIVREKLEIVC